MGAPSPPLPRAAASRACSAQLHLQRGRTSQLGVDVAALLVQLESGEVAESHIKKKGAIPGDHQEKGLFLVAAILREQKAVLGPTALF